IYKVENNGKIESGKNIYINANEFNSIGNSLIAKNNVILTGNTAKILNRNGGELNYWYQFETDSPYLNNWVDENDVPGTWDIAYDQQPMYFKLIDKFYSWTPNDLSFQSIMAGNNIVLDFKNAIDLERKLPDTNGKISKIIQKGEPSFALVAKNIVINSNNINISTNLKSENNLSVIAGQNLNINHAQLTSGQSQSLIANNDLILKQVNLSA
ncbi:DUF637 domain-containing protein, partial [Klebsiella pneumoniae]